MSRVPVVLAVAALLCACSDDGGGDKTPLAPVVLPAAAGGVTLSVVEAGRFRGDGVEKGTFDGQRLLAYRIASFGKTRVRVTLKSDAFDPALAVDGPVPESSGAVVAFDDDGGGGTASALELTLDEGIYRLVVGSYEAFAGETPVGGAFTLEFACLDDCALHQLSLSEMLNALVADHGAQLVDDLVGSSVPALFADTQLVQDVTSQAQALLQQTTFDVDAFPVIPLSAVALAQGLIEPFFSETPAPPPGPVTFDLDQMLTAGCTPTWPGLEPVTTAIPDLTRGGVPDHRFDDCALARAQQLADVLNNLALENGSKVVHGADSYGTVEAAVRGLIDAGHAIEIENNRYYADFIGLYYKGKSVAAPLWLDTGIKNKKGVSVKVPATHAHYHIKIRGPLIDAELAFYMGIPGGTTFRAAAHYPRTWSGIRTQYRTSSQEDPEKVVKMFVTAAKLRKKWHQEGSGLPVEGYGQLGVCLDSTAVIEQVLEGTATLFPLAHPVVTAPEDEIDAILAKIPSDLGGTGGGTAVQRLLTSQPFDTAAGVDLTKMPFPTMKSGLEDL
jgi:hypothetical protein